MELKKLLDAINVQSGLLDELLAVLERETSEMGDINLSGMSVSNQVKEELTNKIAGHAQIMQQAISGLAAGYGLPATTSLKSIAEHLLKKGNGELLSKQQQLSMTADRIQQVAALNLEIAERFSSTVTTSLSLITRLINQSNVYGATGGYQQRQTGAVMINREA